MPHTRPVCIRHEEHGSTPSNSNTYKLSVSKPPILKQWRLPKWLAKMAMTTMQSSKRDQPWRDCTVRSFQRPSSHQLQTRNVAQLSNLVNDPTDPIGEPLVQHLEIQRLGIAMGQMLGAVILDLVDCRHLFLATGTTSTATREGGFAILSQIVSQLSVIPGRRGSFER